MMEGYRANLSTCVWATSRRKTSTPPVGNDQWWLWQAQVMSWRYQALLETQQFTLKLIHHVQYVHFVPIDTTFCVYRMTHRCICNIDFLIISSLLLNSY